MTNQTKSVVKRGYIPLRYIFVLLAIVFEVCTILVIVVILNRFVPYFYVLCLMTQIGCIIDIVGSDDNPDYKIPWLLLVGFIPVAGFMLFFMFYSRKLKPKFVKRLNALKEDAYRKDDSILLSKLTYQNRQAAPRQICCIVPHIPDKKIIFSMTQSYYKRLMEAGVRIYEYEPGFIHAKSYVADDMYAMIGTINLDYRSLVHHFENGIWMYDCDVIDALKQDMEETFTKSIEVTADMMDVGVAHKVFRAAVRAFSPML